MLNESLEDEVEYMADLYGRCCAGGFYDDSIIGENKDPDDADWSRIMNKLDTSIKYFKLIAENPEYSKIFFKCLIHKLESFK